ncbi:MAG: S8 family serine peptidase [Dinghuibacter sp.]|nr:S8 family serine peptidase [Dinghuibacter sp.]
MKHYLKLFLVTLFMLANFVVQAGNHILIQFSSRKAVPASEFDVKTQLYTLNSSDDNLNSILRRYSIKSFRQAFPNAAGIQHPKAEGLTRFYRLETTEGCEKLMVEIADSKSKLVAAQFMTADPVALTAPNDYAITGPMWYGMQMNNQHLQLVNAENAWEYYSQGNPNIVTGITDVQFNTNHEDLTGKVLSNAAGNTVGGHGNAVAHLAAGATNNGIGFSSIGYNTMLRLYDYNYSAMLQAAQDGCKVINCSWLDPFCSYVQPYQDIIDIIHDTYGAVIVAGAGNGAEGAHCGGPDGNGYAYPASYNHVISVTSVHYMYDPPGLYLPIPNAYYGIKDHHRQWYVPNSKQYMEYTYTHNDKVDICAPGYAVPSISGTNQYSLVWGTSFSSPMVAGLCALILSVNPAIPPDDVEKIIKCSARDLMEIQDNFQFLGQLGAGRIDAEAALKMAARWSGSMPSTSPTVSDILWYGREHDGSYTLLPEGDCTPGVFNYSQLRLEANPGTLAAYQLKWVSNYIHNGINTYFGVKFSTPGTNYIELQKGVDYDAGTTEYLKVAVRADDCVPGNYYSEYVSYNPPCGSNKARTVAVGLEADVTSGSFSLYPNPASNKIQVRNSAFTGATWSYAIKNAAGQTITAARVNTREITINVSGYSNGVYVMEAISQGRKVVKQFVVTN